MSDGAPEVDCESEHSWTQTPVHVAKCRDILAFKIELDSSFELCQTYDGVSCVPAQYKDYSDQEGKLYCTQFT